MSMAPLYLLGKDNQHKVQHDFLWLCDTTGVSMLMALSMSQLHLFGHNDQKRCNMIILVM